MIDRPVEGTPTPHEFRLIHIFFLTIDNLRTRLGILSPADDTYEEPGYDDERRPSSPCRSRTRGRLTEASPDPQEDRPPYEPGERPE